MRIPFLSRRRAALSALSTSEVLGTVVYALDASGNTKPVGTSAGTVALPVALLGTQVPVSLLPGGSPLVLWDGPGVAVSAGYSTAYPTWANGNAAGTFKNLSIPTPKNAVVPAVAQQDAVYAIAIQNLLAGSALTINVLNVLSFNGGANQYIPLDGASNQDASLTVIGSGGTPLKVKASGAAVFLVQGWMLGVAGELSITNDSVIADAGTVTVPVQVWRL